MRKLITLLALMLIAVLATCQVDYPKLVLIEDDSVAVMSIEQVRKMNKTFIKLDKKEEELLICDSLYHILFKYKEASDTLLEKYSEQLVLKDSIILKTEEKVTVLKNDSKVQYKRIEKLSKSRKFYAVSGFVSGLLSVAIIRSIFGN